MIYMLRNIDQDKMNRLMNENEEVKQIISQLISNHHTMISAISHEIRNPLTLISSSLQIMEFKYPEVLSLTGWSQLIDDVKYLQQLLEELSTFNNGNTLNLSTFSLEPFLKKIALSFAISLEEPDSDLSFTSYIQDDLGDFLGDRIKLESVLLNLLRNAKEALKKVGTIHLSATKSDTELSISVQDNGYGIEPENLKTIFDPFVTFKSNGTGLGLAIARQIVEAHNGELLAESVIGTGSIFTMRFLL